jgi:type III pantothenate kinase
MLLLIDAGNSRIKWAVPTADTGAALPPVWLHSGCVTHAELDRLTVQWAPLEITRILISNVAGEALQASLEAILLQTAPGVLAQRLSSTAHCAGLSNGYQNPTQLGTDRFASAIGARALYPQRPLIVATCGTATTIDAVTAEGVFLGGMILPGLQLMAHSLARNTAQLPQVAQSTSLKNMFADNTDQAIVSGCINAQLGAIQRAIETMAASQQQPVTGVISGGAAPYLIAHLGQVCQHSDNLVLTGLLVVAKFTDDSST